MFSDTHCHLSHVADRGENLTDLLDSLAREDYRFVLDVGTKPGDFASRVDRVAKAAESTVIPPFLHFSCGLWPDGDVIANRDESLRMLEDDIASMLDLASRRSAAPDTPVGAQSGPNAVDVATSSGVLHGKGYAALGECGIDRYWNGPAAAERIAALSLAKAEGGIVSQDDGPGTTDIAGEEELFGLQLDMAKRYALPVIVHSRDAFDATIGSIKNGGWDVGVIHCWSYGLSEARAFLDRGWYISFPGNVTWAKKDADRERIASLLRYVPRDRLLLETDSPYMAPAPHRGETNTPYLVRHVYERAADILGMDVAALAFAVHANASELFSVK